MTEFGSLTGAEQFEWNAIHTRYQHEKLVTDSLRGNGFEVFLPTYQAVRQWTDRKKQISLPLFPCYVFARSNFERRFRILTTLGVHSVLMFSGRPAVIPDSEIDAIRKAVDGRLQAEPHPFLRSGDWVRVQSGPLADVEGILVRRKAQYRLVLSCELLAKSVAVEVDAFNVKPITRREIRPLLKSGEREFENPQVA